MLKLTFYITLITFTICTENVFGDVSQSCDNYAKCLEQLEEKQRECRESFALRKKAAATIEESDDDSKCSKKRNHDLHYEITGLNLRKTENIRDCIQQNLETAEEIKTFDARKKCQHQFDKLLQTLNTKLKRSKKPKQGKKQRKLSHRKEETRCKKERKLLHKKCHKIGKCCNLVQKCYDKAAPLLSQINEMKTTLKTSRAQCRAI
uniref:Uncharacterized protein n=1 Tax=Panagrolaimus sp. PS1159 TaxID=55785 RepID=A0AC35FYZ6_9BILA